MRRRNCGKAFKVFDRDSDGYVDGDEIKYVMKGLGHDLDDDYVTELIQKGDGDHDGKLNYEGTVYNNDSCSFEVKGDHTLGPRGCDRSL